MPRPASVFTATLMTAMLLVSGAARVGATTKMVEIGHDDQRISFMGPDGSTTYAAQQSSVAYDSVHAEYLVVWSGDTVDGDLGDGELEVWGQRIDATNGDPVGGVIRISDMGPDGNTSFRAVTPDVVYNPSADEFLVVWSGLDDTTDSAGEEEIWGQRIEGGTGAEVGTNDFRISHQGLDGDAGKDAKFPAVAYDSVDDVYLVVWMGDDNLPLANDEFEIWGQRLDGATGLLVGATGFRISESGADGNASTRATSPAVAYDAADNEFLVVWSASDDTAPLVAGEYEIWGQAIDASDGSDIGTDFRISDMGPDGSTAYRADDPAVAHDPVNDQFLVVWSGDDDTAPLVDNDFEIFGQLIDGVTLAEVGGDFRISFMGPDGNNLYPALTPAVVYQAADQEYQVFWNGSDNTPPYTFNARNIFGQRLSTTDATSVGDRLAVSAMGPPSGAYDAAAPAAVVAGAGHETFVVWEGDDDQAPLVDDEKEIFGQRLLVTPDWMDLAVTVTDGVTTADPGGTLTYTLVVSNLGSGVTVAATVSDAFPAALTCTWSSVAAGGASGNGSGAGDVAEALSMPSGSSVTYTVGCDIAPTATGTLTNSATIVAPGYYDTAPGNDTATDGDTVLADATDLAVTISAGVSSVDNGDTIVYTVLVTNNGLLDVTGASVADIMPPQLGSCTWSCTAGSGASCAPAMGNDLSDTPDLEVGSSIAYSGSCTVSASPVFESVTSTVVVATPAGIVDSVPANDSASATALGPLVFGDGFESGSAAAWSASIP